MRVVFAGPSVYGAEISFAGLDRRGPARHGDVFAAVEEGASVIGLVDGYFGWTAATWHKELLYALSRGVRVLGASSMGALRAAECAFYGMEPVGVIAKAFASGALVDDDEVALVHGPAEMDFMPLTEAMVDVTATLDVLRGKRLVTPEEHRSLVAGARKLHFADREPAAIVRRAGFIGEPAETLLSLYQQWHFSQKQQDAIALVGLLRTLRPERGRVPADWAFAETAIWKRAFKGELAA